MATAADDQTDKLGMPPGRRFSFYGEVLVPEALLLKERAARERAERDLAASRSLQEGTADLLGAAESRLAAAEECLREIDGCVGHFHTFRPAEHDFPYGLVAKVARIARAFLAGGKP